MMECAEEENFVSLWKVLELLDVVTRQLQSLYLQAKWKNYLDPEAPVGRLVLRTAVSSKATVVVAPAQTGKRL
jgi:hypothetical protein